MRYYKITIKAIQIISKSIEQHLFFYLFHGICYCRCVQTSIFSLHHNFNGLDVGQMNHVKLTKIPPKWEK